MAEQLSAQTIETVKATIPALEAHGLEVTERMYERLFENDAIRRMFNQSHQGGASAQPKSLANAILAYAGHIDRLDVLGPMVERIAQKHAGLLILPEHYPFVGEALVAAIKDVLGEAASEDILAAWGEAYWFLADILIGREAEIYRANEKAPGGWAGWRDFTITAVKPESEVITSFILEPVDGKPVLRHKPGQYLTFLLDIPGHEGVRRNYSISSAPSDTHYRISVKRETQGIASIWLHNHARAGTVLKAAAPAGDFFLPDEVTRPVVLMSGGVGLTPLVSMLNHVSRTGAAGDVHFVHGAQNGAVHAMKTEVEALAGGAPGIQATTFYEMPRPSDTPGRDYHHEGRIDAGWLAAHTPTDEAEYYLCGPRGFLAACVAALKGCDVPESRVHYEFFGPAEALSPA